MPFVVQNRPAADFASWAAIPGNSTLDFSGDFNGDVNGISDLALINFAAGWNTVPVALSDASGFSIQNRLAPDFASWATTPGVVAFVGDFNGDGTDDFALVNHFPGWNTVPVALSSANGFTIQNRPVGDFASWAATPGIETIPVQTFVGDFNGDGTDDFALVNHFPGWNTVPIALSSANGFSIQNRPVGDFASWAATPGVEAVKGDFNNDGSDDLALVNHAGGWNTVPVALSNATGFTVENRPAPDFASWATTPGVQTIVGDYNGDGSDDLALLNHLPGWNTVPVALSFVSSFGVQNRFVGDFASWATTFAVEAVKGDYDGDGSDDLALVNHSAGWNTVPLALSSATDFFVENRPAPDFASWATTPGARLNVGDYNGDGTSDLSLVNHAAGWNTVPVALSLP